MDINMDKVFFVVTVGRQVDGDIQLCRFEKAFKKASKADEYAKNLSGSWKEEIQTETGPTTFVLRRGIHECEFDDTD